MTKRRVVFTEAARQDMKFRGIAKREAMRCIATGEEFEPSNPFGGAPRVGRTMKGEDGREIRVVWIERKTGLQVISVHAKLSRAKIKKETEEWKKWMKRRRGE